MEDEDCDTLILHCIFWWLAPEKAEVDVCSLSASGKGLGQKVQPLASKCYHCILQLQLTIAALVQVRSLAALYMGCSERPGNWGCLVKEELSYYTDLLQTTRIQQ